MAGACYKMSNNLYSHYSYKDPFVFLDDHGARQTLSYHDLPNRFSPHLLPDFLMMRFDLARKQAKKVKTDFLIHLYTQKTEEIIE